MKILALMLMAKTLTPPIFSTFVIWNVGQGSWSTLISQSHCIHFDMGGEKWPIGIVGICGKKANFIFISHMDWDHRSFIRRFSSSVSKVCAAQGTMPSLPHTKCDTWPQAQIDILKPCQELKSRNANSKVFSINRSLLFPGDSTKQQEKAWLHKINRTKLKYLIAGHHGSNTSTSEQLLASMPSLRLIFVSARKKKYGHPHPRVVRRAHNINRPVIETEKWGHIALHLPPEKLAQKIDTRCFPRSSRR